MGTFVFRKTGGGSTLRGGDTLRGSGGGPATYTVSQTANALVLKTQVAAQSIDARVLGWEAPINVVATTVDQTHIDVTWTAIPTATEYDVERDGVIVAQSHPSTTFNDSGLDPSTQYTYRVRAVR